jgi:hypothetical protein
MKIIVKALVVIGLITLCACAQLQQKIDTQVDAALSLALPDLDQAHAQFISSKDPTTYHSTCWTGLAAAIRAQDAADAAAGAPASTAPTGAGVATLAESLLMTDATPIVINLPPLPVSVRQACFATIGELRVKATVDALKFEGAITATMKKLKL